MKLPSHEMKQLTDSGYSEVISSDTVRVHLPSEAHAIETLTELANSTQSGQLSFSVSSGELPLFRGSHLDYYRIRDDNTLYLTGTVSADTHYSYLRRDRISPYDTLAVTPLDVAHQLCNFLKTKDIPYEEVEIRGGDTFVSLGETSPSKGAIFIEQLSVQELQLTFEIECDDPQNLSSLYGELLEAAALFSYLHDFSVNINGRTGVDAQHPSQDIYIGRSEQFSPTIAERILWEQLDRYNDTDPEITLSSEFTQFSMLESMRNAVDETYIETIIQQAIIIRRSKIYSGDSLLAITNEDVIDAV